jgi:hypothetical protein
MIAFWLIIRFNLFCGVSSAFREVPQVRTAWSNQELNAAPAKADSMSG